MTGAIETDEVIGRARVLGGECVAALAAAFIRVCDEWLTGAGE